MEEDEERNFRRHCLVAMIAGALTWLVGLVTGALAPLILGGAIAVAAACGYWWKGELR